MWAVQVQLVLTWLLPLTYLYMTFALLFFISHLYIFLRNVCLSVLCMYIQVPHSPELIHTVLSHLLKTDSGTCLPPLSSHHNETKFLLDILILISWCTCAQCSLWPEEWRYLFLPTPRVMVPVYSTVSYGENYCCFLSSSALSAGGLQCLLTH